MTSIDMNAEYASAEMLQEYLQVVDVWQRDAAAYREAASARSELGLAYGPKPRQRLDLFAPEHHPKPSSGPVVLFIHGGYWQSLDRSYFSHLARGANGQGISVAIVEYTLCPEVPLSDIVDELRDAVVFLAKRFRGPVTVCGHSAGGHLAACMLATDWHAVDPSLDASTVQAGLSISGLFDLEPLVSTMLNDKLGLDMAEARRLSPITWPPPVGERLHAYAGAKESSELRGQSRTIADTWRPAGVDASYIEVPGQTHFSVIAELADPSSPMVSDLASLARATTR